MCEQQTNFEDFSAKVSISQAKICCPVFNIFFLDGSFLGDSQYINDKFSKM